MTLKPYAVIEAIPADYWFLGDGPELPVGTVVYEYRGHTYGAVREPNIAVSLEPGATSFYGIPCAAVEELTHLPQLDGNGNPADYALCDIDGGLIANSSGHANCERCRDWWDSHDPDEDGAQ
jgi:hypothetical protein